MKARGNGRLELTGRPFTTRERPDGNFEVEILAQSPEEIERFIPHIAAKLRIPESHLRAQLNQAQLKVIERRPDTHQIRLKLGGPPALRSAAKSCLVLWATKVGNTEARRTPYKEARYFVRRSGRAFNRHRTMLDTRPLPGTEAIAAAYGPLFNLVYVRSNAVGRVIGHFTVCNIVGHQIMLAENGGTPNQQIALISNPLDTKAWSDKAAELFDVPFDWLDAPRHDTDLSRERMMKVGQTYFEVRGAQERNRIIDSVFDERGFGPNDPIPPDQLPIISAEIMERLVRHGLGMPLERTMSFEQILKRFARKSQNS